MKTLPLALSVLLTLAAPSALAATCSATVESTDAMKFTTTSLPVSKACKTFTITLKHTGKLPRATMGHNIVISKTADMAAVNKDAMAAGLAAEYVKPKDPRVVAFSKVIGGGQSTTVSFAPAKLTGGAYSFFCSFPGHAALMKGTIELTP